MLLAGIVTSSELFQEIGRRPFAIDGEKKVIGQPKPKLDGLVAHPEIAHLPLGGQLGEDQFQDILSCGSFGLSARYD